MSTEIHGPLPAGHSQEEMPFAIVRGEPLSMPPRDLYIPPDALEVFLEAFEGPLDLLLYLIKRQNLDILDIPIAEITRDDYARCFDINVAGTLFTLQAVARHMIARGQGGKIINMASQAGRRGEALVGV